MDGLITPRLLLACRLAYGILPDGSLAAMPSQQVIGMGEPIQTFILGPDKIDAALFGIADDAMILAFRGTIIVQSPDTLSRIADWLNDADAIPVLGAGLPGHVHRGFLLALDALWPAVLPILTAALADPANAQKPLYVTGHSKGGSMAFLAAARIAATLVPQPMPYPTRVQCITFAAARAGDVAFANAFDHLVPHAIRYEYQDDIVPHVPPQDILATGLADFPELGISAPTGAGLFESAGTLAFFDWTGATCVDSFSLQLKRAYHILECLTAKGFDGIVADHSIATISGYARDVFAPAAAV